MSDSRSALAVTLQRIRELIGAPGAAQGGELDVDRLSVETALLPQTIRALLRGESVCEGKIKERVAPRLRFLRNTRKRDDGRPYSLADIAKTLGVAPATLSNIERGASEPMATTAAGIEKFFGVPSGFLTVDAPQALNAALQPTLLELERNRFEELDVRGFSMRRLNAEDSGKVDSLSVSSRRVLMATLAALVEQEEETRSSEGSGGAD